MDRHPIGRMPCRPGAPSITRAMGLLRRDEGPGGGRYRMRSKLFAIGDDYWIDTDDDRHAFKVNGKAMRIRDTFVLEGPAGEELFKAQERKLRVRFTIDVQAGGELNAKGNIVDHEYEIERDGRKVAEISKRWFRVRDTYGIEIAPGEDDALILAITACIDEMAERR